MGAFREHFIKDPKREIDLGVLELKFGELEAVKGAKGNPGKFVEAIRSRIEEKRDEWMGKLKKSTFDQMTSRDWLEEMTVDWSKVIGKVIPRVELATQDSEFRRIEAVRQYRENQEEFIKMVYKSAKKLYKKWDKAVDPGAPKWMYKEFYDLKDASVVVTEIACERGMQTEKIVNEMVRLHKHALLDSSVKPLRGKKWMLEIVNGKSMLKPHQRIDAVGMESKAACCIVGLNEGGLPLPLSTQIGSVNTEAGLEISRILLESVIEMKRMQIIELDDRVQYERWR